MDWEAARAARRAQNRSDELAEKGWYHSFRFPGGECADGVVPLETLRQRWARMPLPESLAGKRVLDIGAWDGWFSFEAERRGACVTAVDCIEVPNFLYARERLGSRVDYRVLDVFELPRAGLGQFDYVFFLGVLYHVKHPLLALEIVCALCRGIAVVDSFVTDGDDWQKHPGRLPVLEFYETDELGGLLDNWFGPSVGCLEALCRAAGFARTELLSAAGARAAFACYRFWEDPPDVPGPGGLAVGHSRNFGLNFYSSREEYLNWVFQSPEEDLRRAEVRLEVGGFGVPAMSLKRQPGGYFLSQSRLPPGLAPGPHAARARTARSGWSEPVRVWVDVEPRAGRLLVEGVCDGQTWKRGETAGFLSCWVGGLADNCDRNNLHLRFGACRAEILYIGDPDVNGFRQVNARVPVEVAAGEQMLTAGFGGVVSPPVALRIMRA